MDERRGAVLVLAGGEGAPDHLEVVERAPVAPAQQVAALALLEHAEGALQGAAEAARPTQKRSSPCSTSR